MYQINLTLPRIRLVSNIRVYVYIYIYIFVQKKGKNGAKKRGSVYADLGFDILYQSNLNKILCSQILNLRYNVRYDVLLQYNTRLRIPRIPNRAT